jgi:EAL domain-containing protein (putative c-di-GMP-specific phosphodiesterase class I)
MIIVAPLILSWSGSNEHAWPWRRKLEASGFVFLLLISAATISSEEASPLAPFTLTFVSLPFIIWGAFRFGQRELTATLAVVCAVAVWYTVERRGTLAAVPLNDLLLTLLTFICIVVTTGLILLAVMEERRLAALPSSASFQTQTMSGRVAGGSSLEHKLRQAIEREEFVLHYQPKIHLESGRIVGVEALIRWNSPGAGVVPPMDFIPLLEETGMILEVGRWALRRAVLDQALWVKEAAWGPRIAVNVSSIQLRQPDFVEVVRDAVAAGGSPASIDLEITESRLMEDVDANIEKLGRLRDLGIGIAIDDFGTGYSSLAYLVRLPVATLKIDSVFIDRMLSDDQSMALVQMIIALAQSLKLTTVAEGVETQEQADMLELLRCDEIQGYFVSRPLPREQIVPLLTRPGAH